MKPEPSDLTAAQPVPRVNGLLAALRPILGLLVSGLFLWLALREVRLRTLVELAIAWPAGPIALALLLQFLAFGLRLYRWGLANRHLGQIGWRRLLTIGSVGLSAVFLLPVRLGEVVRPALVAEESEIGFGRGSATVILERIVDGWIMSGVLFATLLGLGDRAGSSTLRAGAALFAALFLGASALLAVGAAWRQRIATLLGAMIRRFSVRLGDWMAATIFGFLDALRHLAERSVLLPYALLSLALWLVEAGSIFVLFGVLPGRLPWLAALAVLSALVVGSALPSGPTQLGVFEFAVIGGLELMGISQAQAAAYGILLHTLETTTVLAFGLAGTWAGGLGLQRLRQLAGEGHAVAEVHAPAGSGLPTRRDPRD